MGPEGEGACHAWIFRSVFFLRRTDVRFSCCAPCGRKRSGIPRTSYRGKTWASPALAASTVSSAAPDRRAAAAVRGFACCTERFQFWRAVYRRAKPARCPVRRAGSRSVWFLCPARLFWSARSGPARCSAGRRACSLALCRGHDALFRTGGAACPGITARWGESAACCTRFQRRRHGRFACCSGYCPAACTRLCASAITAIWAGQRAVSCCPLPSFTLPRYAGLWRAGGHNLRYEPVAG